MVSLILSSTNLNMITVDAVQFLVKRLIVFFGGAFLSFRKL